MKPTLFAITAALPLLLAGASPALSGNAPARSQEYYCNLRYSYCIDYPQGLLVAQPEPDAGDGRRFVSKDGRAVLSVWGFYNILNTTLKVEYREAGRSDSLFGRLVTYKLLKDNFFVVSGFEGDEVFYRKTMSREGTFINYILRYPKSQRQIYDPLVEKLSLRFNGTAKAQKRVGL